MDIFFSLLEWTSFVFQKKNVWLDSSQNATLCFPFPSGPALGVGLLAASSNTMKKMWMLSWSPNFSKRVRIVLQIFWDLFFGSSHILEYSQQTFLANINAKQRCCCVIRGFDRWDAGESRNEGRHHAGQLIFPTTAMPASKLLVFSRGSQSSWLHNLARNRWILGVSGPFPLEVVF